ncbi:MAG: diacylglycerol kinase family protein [Hyphomonadaceae bacterium]|nr:diacylglycerol kinase family protein [Hyphomonadaceae bacterium]
MLDGEPLNALSRNDQSPADLPDASGVGAGAILAIANPVAGSASKLDLAALDARLRETIGVRFGGMTIAAPDAMEATLKAMVASRPAAIVVVGGDGTARSAAKAAMAGGGDTAIVPLPAGTMNILPRLVFGHADLDRAVTELADMKPATLPAGFVGGEPFFLSAAFGFAASLARLRETMRPPRKWPEVAAAAGACARASLHSLRGGPHYRTDGARWRRAHTLVVAVGSVARVTAPDAAPADVDTLEVAALHLRSGIDALRVGGVALTSGWRTSRHMRVLSARAVEVRMRSHRPMVVLDGEPVRVSRVDAVTFKARAVPILAPADRA